MAPLFRTSLLRHFESAVNGQGLGVKLKFRYPNEVKGKRGSNTGDYRGEAEYIHTYRMPAVPYWCPFGFSTLYQPSSRFRNSFMTDFSRHIVYKASFDTSMPSARRVTWLSVEGAG